MSRNARADVVAAFSSRYGLALDSIAPGPRQYVAETFIATDRCGRRYFCKATYKRFFIPAIVASLEAMEQLHALVPDRTCRPLRTSDGALHVEIPGGILVVLGFVEGEVSYDYSYYTFGAVTAQIHGLTAQIACPVPEVSFHEALGESPVIARLEQACSYSGDDPILVELKAVAKRRIDRFRRFGEIYRAAAQGYGAAEPRLVMTHGDAPGNVMVRTAEDFTIIDWDEGMLAPAERDLWVMEHEPDVLRGYCSVRPHFAVDPDARAHSILRYMFSAAGAYLQQAEDTSAPYHERRVHLSGLDAVLDGWMSRCLAPLEREGIAVSVPGDMPTKFPELNELLAELTQRARGILGDNFAGAYLQGSFAVGDGDMDSDCDFLIPIHEPLTAHQEAALRAMHDELPRREQHWTQHLEGSYPLRSQLASLAGLDSEWLYIDHGAREMEWSTHCNSEVARWCLRERGVTLAGPEPRTWMDVVPPDALRARMREQALSLRVEMEGWIDLDLAWAQRYFVATLCRMLYTVEQGEVASKRAALRWGQQRFGLQWAPLLRQVIDDRPRGYDPEDRALPERVEQAIAFHRHAVKVVLTSGTPGASPRSTSNTTQVAIDG